MRNRAGNVEVGRLMEFLTALGQDVKITVKPTRKAVGGDGSGGRVNTICHGRACPGHLA
jgi:hypothetical protein